MSDRIRIRDLLVRTVVGVHEWERKERQDVVLNLTLETDLSRAGASDDLGDGVDYRAITKEVIEHVEATHPLLLERLAEEVAALVLQRHPRVHAVTVQVEKPGALRFARTVGVEIHRRRAEPGTP